MWEKSDDPALIYVVVKAQGCNRCALCGVRTEVHAYRTKPEKTHPGYDGYSALCKPCHAKCASVVVERKKRVAKAKTLPLFGEDK